MEWLKALLKKLGLKDDQIEEVVSKAEEEQASAIENEVKGLKKKNDELLKKSKETKESEGGKVAELEAKLDEITESLAKERKANEIAVKKLTGERDTLAKSLSDTSAKAREYQTGVTLREALGKLGIGKRSSLDMDDAINHIRSKIAYETVEGQEQAFVNYEEIGKGADGKETRTAAKKNLAEYLEKVYPTTDHAKRFIPADGNRGAGAGGQHQTLPAGSGDKPTVKSALAAALGDGS
jgi:uncharacterized protein YoxC